MITPSTLVIHTAGPQNFCFQVGPQPGIRLLFLFFPSPATLQNLSESKTSARSLVVLVYWGFSSSAPLRLDFGNVCVSVNILLSRKLKWQMQDNDIFWVMEESADKSQFVSVFFVAASY